MTTSCRLPRAHSRRQKPWQASGGGNNAGKRQLLCDHLNPGPSRRRLPPLECVLIAGNTSCPRQGRGIVAGPPLAAASQSPRRIPILIPSMAGRADGAPPAIFFSCCPLAACKGIAFWPFPMRLRLTTASPHTHGPRARSHCVRQIRWRRRRAETIAASAPRCWCRLRCRNVGRIYSGRAPPLVVA